MTTTPTSGAADLPAMVSKALREAYNLGQRYWQQADSEYISQHKKADDTRAKFLALVEETCATLAAGQATAAQAGAPANMQVTEKMRAAGDCAWMTADRVDSARVFRAMLAAAPAQPAAQQGVAYAELSESFLEIPDVQDESGINAYYSREVVLECIDAALASHGQAPATQQAVEVRRAELVPGVMHCAKCKFQLNRVTLCVSDGNAYAGNNKTEPCPNGCGPLWPVTWEQEAKNCWKALEEMHERLMAAAAPQPSPTAQAADSVQEDAARESEYRRGYRHGYEQRDAEVRGAMA